jgi:O-antigen/teichoic acid export membrane protein
MNFKRNFMFNSLLTASGYVFTLLTYPYISRVLGLSNVGIVNFVDGLINYFILFAMMGVGTVGIREVAINKNDRNELSKTFSGVITLNTISTLCVLTVIVNGLVNIVYCRKFISKNLHTIIFI